MNSSELTLSEISADSKSGFESVESVKKSLTFKCQTLSFESTLEKDSTTEDSAISKKSNKLSVYQGQTFESILEAQITAENSSKFDITKNSLKSSLCENSAGSESGIESAESIQGETAKKSLIFQSQALSLESSLEEEDNVVTENSASSKCSNSGISTAESMQRETLRNHLIN